MKTIIISLGLIVGGLVSTNTLHAQEKKGNPEKMFAKMDANSDKKVTLDEFKNMKRKNEVATEKLEKQFKRMDANEDGMVEYSEFLQAREKMMARKNKD